jgi:hypothetical protein
MLIAEEMLIQENAYNYLLFELTYKVREKQHDDD